MSRYLFHFTKNKDERNARKDFYSILDKCRLKAAANKGYFVQEREPTVSWTGNHLLTLDRLMERRESRYGFCFNQAKLERKGVRPVIYLSDIEIRLMKNYLKHPKPGQRQFQVPAQNAVLTSADKWCVDIVSADYNFEWEKEWRKLGDFRFDYNDIFFLVAPEIEREHIEKICSVALISYEVVKEWHRKLWEQFGTTDLRRVDPERAEDFLHQQFKYSLQGKVSLMDTGKKPEVDPENPYLTQSGELADPSEFWEEACEWGLDWGRPWD